jgi:TPR repeat protein
MREYADACRDGRGVERDYTRALSWYRKAADAGDARAMADVGVMYKRGWGVAKDHIEATKWFRKGFTAGDGIAAYIPGAGETGRIAT